MGRGQATGVALASQHKPATHECHLTWSPLITNTNNSHCGTGSSCTNTVNLCCCRQHCVMRKFGYLHKLRYFPLELCPKLWTLKNLLQRVNRIVVVNRWVLAVCYKWINCNPLTPFDLLWICCTVCFYSWQDFDWRSASHSPSAVSEFLLLCIKVLSTTFLP